MTLLASWKVMALAGVMNLTGVTENSAKDRHKCHKQFSLGWDEQGIQAQEQEGGTFLNPVHLGRELWRWGTVSGSHHLGWENRSLYFLHTVNICRWTRGGFAMPMGLKHWHLWPGHACVNKAHLTTIPPILHIRGSGKFTSYPGPF